MRMQKVTLEVKERFYRQLRFNSDVYKKFRELTKVGNLYTKPEIDKFLYHPFASTKDKQVWSYYDIIITCTKTPPYMTLEKK